MVLSTTVVIALSFPSPDGQYNIPDVGSGQRSQFYVLHSDGTYKYGYDTGDGAFESVKTQAAGDVTGKFGYTDPDGNEITLEYDTTSGGFVARGDHLPQPSPELTQALASVVRSSAPFIDPLASDDTDPSYDFKFQSENYTRNEISDEDGSVTGSFSYLDEFGRTRTYRYRAGAGIGFVIEGDDIPQDANSIAASASSQASNFRTSTNFGSSHSGTRAGSQTRTRVGSHSGTRAGSQTRTRVGSHSNVRANNQYSSNVGAHTSSSNRASRFGGHSSSHQSSQRTSQFNSGNAAISSQSSQAPRDASYSFSYNAEDHSRSETSDPDLNVQGSYSFIGDDGQERTLNYVAGTGTGFQAEGAHLPVAPDADFGNRISSTSSSSSRNRVSSNTISTSTRQRPSTFRQSQSSSVGASSAHRQQSYQAPSASSSSSNRFSTSQSFSGSNNAFRASSASSGNQFEEANIRSSSSPDGSYSFSYDSSSQSRSESGDNQNNVRGNFAFVADDDGQQRQIQYEANAQTGFIAEGAHIPVGPEVPGAPSGQPTGRIVPVPEVRFDDPLADSDSDASYDFKFDSETYSRSETSDADGNVSGTYTVVDDDGTRTTYRFRAGKGIGYESEVVSVSQGAPPSKTTQTSSFQNQGSSALRSSSSSSFSSSQSAGRPSSSSSSFSSSQTVGRPSSSSSFSNSQSFRAPSSSSFSSSQSAARPSTSYSRPQTSFRGSSTSSKFGSSSSHRTSGSHVNSLSTSGSRFSTSNTSPTRTSLTSQTSEVFPGFQLHQYDAAKNPEKFGYVLKFD